MTYDKFKAYCPKVVDGWYLVKNGLTYKVDFPINTKFTKSVNILTGEVYYPSNAGRIRSMTDEELAEFLNGTDGDFLPTGEALTVSAGEKRWTEWLKAPVEVEEGKADDS